ncbi:MAG: ATP-dependent metalloprotease FtsH [Lachnospiraceae bacterium]|jgi:cell division protease FtsH|nr:ATP-dependent metalloprotease FtsH [Lachnospiraceae bacterium]
MKKKGWIILLFLLVLSIGLAGYSFINKPKLEMSYPSFLDAVNLNRVDSVTFTENSNSFLVVLEGESDNRYTVPNPKTENFTEFLLVNDITIYYTQDNIAVQGLQALLVIGIVGGVFFFLRKGGHGNIKIKDATKMSDKASSITLDQIAGNMEAKLMVEDIIQFIKDPGKYSSVGARMPKGLLLYGPPGTGKTMMAKAIAGEAGVPFFAMSGSDFVQMYVGVGASRIRNLFQKAKKSEKAVIFIDEIDAIGKKRARSLSASNDERDQTLNALLTEMSGFHENSGIVVIGATNRLDTLDEALLRPGRFDRQVEIGLPDINSRKKILALYAQSKPMALDVNLDALAKSTVYFSGAMLENLLNEAAINAANANEPAIRQAHIDTAFYTVIAGAPKMDRSFVGEKDRTITATHEAGHALVTKLLLPTYYISKVTIIPSVKGAGGFNLSIPSDTLYQTKKQILSSIQMLLAGRAAEELVFGEGEITTGASNDIQKASALIIDYINKYGMDNDMGLFHMESLQETGDPQLISKCRDHMNQLYEETKRLLESNIEALKEITSELLEKESLNGEDIELICKDTSQ